MAEINRLLQTNFISEEFLKEECRCSYNITPEIKKVWAIQLALLNDFIQVCKEHNLTYWAIGGTLLGAIRHNGYIPWDDDIDVSMPRKDYDVLISHPEWFQAPSVLHLPSNSERYFEGWARLHNTNTAVLYNNYKKEGGKQGIYLDIFPLDDYENTKSERKNIEKIWKTNIVGHAFTYNVNKSVFAKTISAFTRLFHLFNCEKQFCRVNKIAKQTNNESKYLASKMVHSYNLERQFFNREDYRDSIAVPFEFMHICVPIGYDNILHQNYGDYKEFPPVEKRGTWHDFIFDTENSFLTYRGQNKRTYEKAKE